MKRYALRYATTTIYDGRGATRGERWRRVEVKNGRARFSANMPVSKRQREGKAGRQAAVVVVVPLARHNGGGRATADNMA